MSKTILVIDDEIDLIELLEYNLGKEGYSVKSAQNGKDGLEMAKKYMPQLIVLDIMMPKLDGLEVCRTLRGNPDTAEILILMLTAKAEEMDKVVGLEMGADDYMVKPFGVRELLARIKALLRRSSRKEKKQEVFRMGDLTVDSGRRKVFIGESEIELTATEFDILRALSERQGRVMTRDELLDEARGKDLVVLDRTIDVHIVSLRRKLGVHANLIETVRGVGYRMRE